MFGKIKKEFDLEYIRVDEITGESKKGIKRVIVVYDYRLYSEKNYRLDFRDFRAYHAKREFKGLTEKEKIAALDWKFYDEKKFPFINFSDFLEIVSNLLTRIVEQVLKQDPSIMVSDDNKFIIKFVITRVPGREWYFEEDPKSVLSDNHPLLINELEAEPVENHYYLTAGVFLIQAIAAPWFYYKRVDYSYIHRYLVHELEHHKQLMRGYFAVENKIIARLKERFKERVPKSLNYRVTYLFLTMQGLLAEGIADFVTIANRPKIDIHMDWIYVFRRNLDKLTTMSGKNNVEKFWVENLAHGIFAGGAYYCGKVMCFIIGLAFAKKLKKEPLVYVGENAFPLHEIDKIMSNNKVFYVGNLDPAVFKVAYAEITKKGYNYRRFIALYEWACGELGIRKRNRVVWYRFFDDLKKKATKFYERYTKKRRNEVYKIIEGLRR